MIRRALPGIFEHLHSAEFLQRNTTPVCWRAGHLQSTVTLPAILVAQHTDLALTIPAQPVRTEPPLPALIDRSDRAFAHHRPPDQPINVLDRLDPGLNNSHLISRYAPLARIFNRHGRSCHQSQRARCDSWTRYKRSRPSQRANCQGSRQRRQWLSAPGDSRRSAREILRSFPCSP
jgi:hypothetical protein